MIRTKIIHEDERGSVALQFATSQFALGFSWEWETTLFVFFGPFILVVHHNG